MSPKSEKTIWFGVAKFRLDRGYRQRRSSRRRWQPDDHQISDHQMPVSRFEPANAELSHF